VTSEVHALATSPPLGEKPPPLNYQLDKRLGGHQSRSEQQRKEKLLALARR